ncbi:MAG: hypothetical protein KKE62_15160 [Proteobacteria bacterium]|nr:hypothetical protein [Pseudomonadota bacterium]MBU1389957.1 hypothetical protein [Pseudomonadota bacterium]MBU1544171.1 hypothetical protein [Pseudomonadota bacterium]
MTQINEESQRLASLAIFRELYDNQKDIYTVISCFLDEIITNQGKHEFNITEITNLLNKTFDFSIPDAVVQTALRKLEYLKKEEGNFIVTNFPKKGSYQIGTRQEEILSSNNIIVENLFLFIEAKKNQKLGQIEKERIVHCFGSFLINDSDGEEYSDYISAFVISNKKNEDFRQQLNKIREGVLLYSGLTYNSNLSETGSWKTELTIYLDTELLFHFVGYNGELYQSLFNGFYSYVKEINNKAPQRLIKFKYFREVADEVENFFSKASFILEGKDSPKPNVTAMNSVLDGCKKASDLIEKKSDFFLFLKTNDITKDESIECFDKSNHEFNILDQKTIEAISKEFGFDIVEPLCLLNYVHINRKQANLNNFYNIGSILLTGKIRTIRLAWHELVKDEGNVPLATTLDWITNKFWFKLNKGFGNGGFPKSFDIITKAQIVLSHVLNESVGEKYDELQKKYKDGVITEDQVKARILNLRTQVKKPEDINQEDVSQILSTITEDTLEKFILSQEHFKNKAQQQELENFELKKSLKKEKEKNQEIGREKNQLSNEIIASKEKLLVEKEGIILLLKDQQEPIDREVKKAVIILKSIIFGSIIIFYAIFYFLISQLGWDRMEQWTWILTFSIPVIFYVIYFLITEKTIDPKKIFEKRRQKIRNLKYKHFRFDDDKLQKLLKETEELKIDIGYQKKQLNN